MMSRALSAGVADGVTTACGGPVPVGLATSVPLRGHRPRGVPAGSLFALVLPVAMLLCACGGGSEAGAREASADHAEPSPAGHAAMGSPVPVPPAIPTHAMSGTPDAMGEGTAIDMSRASEGIIMASSANQPARVKLTVACGQMAYQYDMPADGTPIAVPANMGSGFYHVALMLNVEGNNYVEILSAERDVALSSEFAPFLVPNEYCSYSESSACVQEARRIAQGSSNQGDLARGICEYVMSRLEYDNEKARACENATGYVPDPDSSLGEGKGICFDYASLCASMFRSSGIPAKVVTGYILPERTYHSWVEAYVDGQWQRYGLSVRGDKWSRLDVTLADGADGDESLVPAESEYEVRFVY